MIVLTLDLDRMAFIWDMKNNFILSHCVIHHHEQQSSILDIDWTLIANEMSLEIRLSPIVK